MSKHFNAGNVWGRVAEVEKKYSEGAGTPYAAITIEAPNEMYGNIKTYGRLWGRDKVDAFIDHHKKNPGAAYRFQGFFSQYEKDDTVRSNFTFFSWQAIDTKEFRATFVLVGEVEEIDGDRIGLYLSRPGMNGREDTEEHLVAYALNRKDLQGIEVGETVEVKGVLRYREAEDYFGGAPEGKVLPYFMALKVRKPEAVAPDSDKAPETAPTGPAPTEQTDKEVF